LVPDTSSGEVALGTTFPLEPDSRTLHGYFSRDFPPVLTIDAGDSVVFRTLESGWSDQPFAGGSYRDRPRVPEYEPQAGHALVGPVAVRGARPGMTLEVRIAAVLPGTWGNCVAGGWPSSFNERYGVTDAGVVHTWRLDPAGMTGRNQHGHTVVLRPFMGVMGMPPPEPGKHSTIPPRVHGGNLDCRELVAGSTLYLPIPVEGALFSVGDGHAAQGDGEVSGTAIECPMDRVELAFGLREDLPLTAPQAHTPAGWITFGLGDTLDDAAFMALDGMYALLGRLHGVSRPDAIALASVAVDLRVTQIVNQVVGVHAVLRPGAIR
jgi:acetamidase/formamidase